MSFNKIRNFFHINAVIFLSFFVINTSAHAKISPLAFKNLMRHFQEGKEAYAPLIGAAALDSGLIFNLRFFGNFDHGYKDNSATERLYSNDHSDDPMWQTLKILFPSVTGSLGEETTFNTNFAKNVDNPETLSLLLNYIEDLRLNPKGEIDMGSVKKRILSTLKQKADTVDLKVPETLPDYIEEHMPQSAGNFMMNLSKFFKDIHRSPIWKASDPAVRLVLKKDTITPFEKQVQILDIITEKIQKHNQKQQVQAEKRHHQFLKTFDEKTLTPLLEAMQKTLEAEKDSVYPPQTLEQILNSFFCFHFNNREDIWTFLNGLSDTIIKKETLPLKGDFLSKTEIFSEEDLPSIVNKKQPYDLEDIFFLCYAETFKNPLPYKEGSVLINNGNAQCYNRQTGDLSAPTFADCFETAVRHVLNMASYDLVTKSFQWTHSKPVHPYSKNFEEFYKQQIPSKANSGDPDTRSHWNTVVGDLNSEEGAFPIRYALKTNELSSGFINTVRVFQRLFDISLNDLTDKKEDWVTQSLDTILTAINPEKTYNFSLDSSDPKTSIDDFGGNLTITTSDKETDTPLYSFLFHVTLNMHTEIRDLKFLKANDDEIDYQGYLMTHAITRQPDSAQNSLWLLMSHLEEARQKITNPFYHLFQKPLADNDSKIEFLNTVDKNYSEWEKDFLLGERADVFNKTLSHVLKDISWDDEETLKKVSPVISSLDQHQALKEILIKSVFSLHLMRRHSDAFYKDYKNLKKLTLHQSHFDQSYLEGFSKLESLDLYFDQKRTNLCVSNLTRLKRIRLTGCDMTSIEGLNCLPDLQILFLDSLEQLTTVSVTGCSNLTEVILDNSAIESIEGLDDLVNLKLLSLQNMQHLKMLSFTTESELESLKLGSSSIESIEGLEKLTNLKSLSLENTKNLKTFSLRNMPNLTSINFRDSFVEELTLENLPEVSSVNLEYVQHLKKLTAKNLQNLSHLDFYRRAIETIDLLGELPNLMQLNLKSTEKLNALTIENLEKLWKIDLTSSSVKTVKGLENINNLQEIGLMLTINLESISEEHLKKVPKVNMILSKFKVESAPDDWYEYS